MRTLNKEKGLTLVIVTHDPNIGAQADRIVHMRDGEIERHVVNTATALDIEIPDGVAAD